MHFLGDGVRYRAADAAADDTDLLQALHLGSLAERSDYIGNNVALLDSVEHSGGAARSLNHNGNGALLTIPSCDGDGNTLALLVKAENHELTGLRMLCDQGSLDLKKADGLSVIQKTLGHYFVHLHTSVKYYLLPLFVFCCLFILQPAP